MASAEELRNIIQRPVTEAFQGLSGKDAAMAALGIFSPDEFKAEKQVGNEMKKLAARYIAVLKAITGVKTGWTSDATSTLLSLDNEKAGIVIDISWKGNAITKKIDVVVDIARRTGPEQPGAKWRNKIHMVRDIEPTSANLNPRKIITDAAVKKFLKENAESLLAVLNEEDGWEELEEAVEIIEKPQGQPTYKARMIIHPQDQKEYGGGAGLKRIKLGNNSELIARVRVPGAPFSGAKFYSSGSMAMTMADAGHDVWKVGTDKGRAIFVSLRPRGVKTNDDARRASYSTYGEPWNLEVWAKKHGIKLGPGSRFGEEKDMGPAELRALIERKGEPYARRGDAPGREADLDKWEKKYVSTSSKSRGKIKRAAAKSGRRAAKREIQARMRGEDATLDDFAAYLEIIGEELAEAMVDADTSPARPIEPVQMRNLKTIHETAAQLGRFTTEFAKWLSGAMRAKQVDVERLGRFGRQVDAAHRIFKDTYRKLALGYREDTDDDDGDVLDETVAKEVKERGDHIKALASKRLGSDKHWMEVKSSQNVYDKIIARGLKKKKSDEAIAKALAMQAAYIHDRDYYEHPGDYR